MWDGVPAAPGSKDRSQTLHSGEPRRLSIVGPLTAGISACTESCAGLRRHSLCVWPHFVLLLFGALEHTSDHCYPSKNSKCLNLASSSPIPRLNFLQNYMEWDTVTAYCFYFICKIELQLR